jgi:hypothetical protein
MFREIPETDNTRAENDRVLDGKSALGEKL